MWQWIAGVILGYLSEFLRDVFNDYAARSGLRENGRLAQENAQLKEQIRVKEEARRIREKVNAEDDFNAVIDGL